MITLLINNKAESPLHLMPFTITFIIASYNDQSDITCTLNSIVNNARQGDEIIIVDGGSSDQTVSNAEQALIGFNKSQIISESDDGIYHAWNKALKLASGTWFSFIGCGDVLKPEYRTEMLAAAEPNTNLIHAIARLYDTKNNRIVKLGTVGRKFNKTEFIKKMSICHAGALHHSSLFLKNNFSTKYRCISDYHFLLMQLDSIHPAFVEKELIKMKIGGISTRSILPLREKFHMNRRLPNSNKIALFFSTIISILKFYCYKVYTQRFYLTNRISSLNE